MIGIVIVTHGRLGVELINTAGLILGQIDHCASVSIDGADDPAQLRGEIEQAVKKTDQGAGVLILTDLFGGTPSNLSLSFLEPQRVEVITGVNLPTLIKLVQARRLSLKEAAQATAEYGRKSISVASEKLGRRPKT